MATPFVPPQSDPSSSDRVSLFPTGFGAALKRHPQVKVRRLTLDLPPVGVITVHVRPGEVGVKSYLFETPPTSMLPAPAREYPRPQAAALKQGRTRLVPSREAVRLEDRLHHLLQPPLQSWLTTESLPLAFEPFPYQWEGIAFLYPRFSAVLADEMGLGKTMQAITAVRLLLNSGAVRRVLLVCPKPLVSNWVREFRIWAPELPTTCIEGTSAKRRWQWGLEDAPVRIANYELLVRDQEILEQLDPPFDLVLLDEAQRIKNRSSATSQIVRAIPRQRSWALTGTPIENSADDLLGIFEFVSPRLLSPQMTPRRMGQCVQDHMLRRTKAKVLTDLPPKIIRDATLSLTPEQQRTYSVAEEHGTIQLAELGQSITIQHVFELVLRLKQICNFDPATGASAKADRLIADLEEVAASGQKAIVFSQWVQSLKELDQRLRPFRPLQFHGQISPARRDGVLDEFRQDPRRHVLLMSYGAGSVGLNLQFAGYVFLFDRWWNPAVEDQAINRAHRIGASGPVTITRFLATGTIEQRIDAILEHKRALFETVLTAADQGAAHLGLTQDEIFGLFSISRPAADGQAA